MRSFLSPFVLNSRKKSESGLLSTRLNHLGYHAGQSMVLSNIISIATRVLRRNRSRTLHSETSPLISTLSQICHCFERTFFLLYGANYRAWWLLKVWMLPLSPVETISLVCFTSACIHGTLASIQSHDCYDVIYDDASIWLSCRFKRASKVKNVRFRVASISIEAAINIQNIRQSTKAHHH